MKGTIIIGMVSDGMEVASTIQFDMSGGELDPNILIKSRVRFSDFIGANKIALVFSFRGDILSKDNRL